MRPSKRRGPCACTAWPLAPPCICHGACPSAWGKLGLATRGASAVCSRCRRTPGRCLHLRRWHVPKEWFSLIFECSFQGVYACPYVPRPLLASCVLKRLRYVPWAFRLPVEEARGSARAVSMSRVFFLRANTACLHCQTHSLAEACVVLKMFALLAPHAYESHLVRMTGQCSRRGTPDTWAAGRPALYDHFFGQWICGCCRCAVQCYTHAARKSWHRKTDDGEGCCACTARELACQLTSLVAIRLRKLPCPCPLRYLGHVGNSLDRSIAWQCQRASGARRAKPR